MREAAFFEVDDQKCIGCGKCILVCPGAVLELNAERKCRMREFEAFGWNGCWKCEHCLSVCPQEAISIFAKKPGDSLPPPDPAIAASLMDALVMNRHSHRRFLQKDVPQEMIDDLIRKTGNAPNGGNKQLVEYTVIDDRQQMERFRQIAVREMEHLAEEGIYPEGFDRPSYEDMKRWEKTVRPDMLFCGAPYLMIPHAAVGAGEPVQDVMIAATYFELLCASRGLGAVMLTFPLGALKNMPGVRALLQIPDNHYAGVIIGFGWPQIRYARGTQRQVDESRIHRLRFDEKTD